MREQPLQNKAALYIRLSKEDAGEGESVSIGTQRDILRRYAQEHLLTIIDEYVDDGYSGTNFDRPAYKRMIADIESGKVNCVVTKDSSRLGRNGAKLLDLLDEYFPSRGVRYIAVTDGYDNASLSSGAATVMPLMAIVNEMYARDTSTKIRSSMYSKMERGEYIGNFAPYGYKKDVEHGDKNHLVIDPLVAPVVRDIFKMAADGLPPSQIAAHLNRRGVATPAEYRCMSRPYLDVNKYSTRKEWTSAGICKMLRNEAYLGKTLQGKTQKVSFKSKATKRNKRENWIVVEGTHEPIISEEIFRVAQNRRVSRRSPPNRGFVNVFAGVAKCADCGRGMSTATTRKKGATYNLCCGGYKTYGARECSNHAIDYDVLYHLVQQELKALITLSTEQREKVIAALLADAQKRQEIATDRQALAQMQRDEMSLTETMCKLYEDFAAGRITKTMYDSIAPKYEADMSALRQSISCIEERIRREPEEERAEAYRKFFALLDKVESVDELTKPLVHSLIDRIEVEQGEYIHGADGKKHKQQTVRIYYRFIGQI